MVARDVAEPFSNLNHSKFKIRRFTNLAQLAKPAKDSWIRPMFVQPNFKTNTWKYFAKVATVDFPGWPVFAEI